jgi:hypothetical protein
MSALIWERLHAQSEAVVTGVPSSKRNGFGNLAFEKPETVAGVEQAEY